LRRPLESGASSGERQVTVVRTDEQTQPEGGLSAPIFDPAGNSVSSTASCAGAIPLLAMNIVAVMACSGSAGGMESTVPKRSGRLTICVTTVTELFSGFGSTLEVATCTVVETVMTAGSKSSLTEKVRVSFTARFPTAH